MTKYFSRAKRQQPSSPSRLSQMQGSQQLSAWINPRPTLASQIFQVWMKRQKQLIRSHQQSHKPSAWMKCQAWASSGLSRITNTVKEQRNPQRRNSPRTPAVLRAPLEGRLVWRKVYEGGDTIIEVMLAMTILAVVLATAYATSNHSLQTGFNSQYRDQALSYAQQQVELIKNADNTSTAAVNTYQLNQFCVDPSTTQVQSVDSTTKVCPWPLGTSSANPSQYSLVDSYSPSAKTFTATVQWQSSNGITNQVVLYYKAHNSFITTTGSSPPPTAPPTTPPPPVGLSFTANPTSVAWQGSSTLTWTTTTATKCVATENGTGGWNGRKDLSGSESVGPLTSTTTYTLTCTGFDGTTVSKDVTVTVAAAPIPTLSFSADSNSISYGASTTLRWTTDSNATSCPASGAWSGNKQIPSGSQGTGSLTSSQTYKLYCIGAGGNSPTKTVTITVAAPPAPTMNYFYANPGSIGYGGSTTLYWSSNNTTSCTWGGSSGSVGTGALYGNTGYTINCSGPGGNTSAYTVVYVSPPPPPPPPPCQASAGGWRSGNNVWITGGGSSCGYYYDNVVGWNGGGVWGPYYSPGQFCHTQQGGADPWGWLSSASWCG